MNNYLEESLRRGPIENVVPIDWERYEAILERLKNEPPIPSVSSGLAGLDAIIGGFETGRLYVLSAPTKQGKTRLSQTFMFNMARQGIPTGMFSYEMGLRETIQTFREMQESTGASITIPIYFPIELHRGGDELHYRWLLEAMMKARDEHGIKFFVIDHLHYLIPLKETHNTSFVIGGVMRELKRISVILNVTILLIAHVGMIKDDRVPTHDDIRDSSFIAQEADVILMMYRIKNKEAAKRVQDESDVDIFTRKAILSVELDRKKGLSGKIKLWHNGVMFVPYQDQDKIEEALKTAQYVRSRQDNSAVIPQF